MDVHGPPLGTDYTLVTMGMGAHLDECAQGAGFRYKLERAELAIAPATGLEAGSESMEERLVLADSTPEGAGSPADCQRYLAGMGTHHGQPILLCGNAELCASLLARSPGHRGDDGVYVLRKRRGGQLPKSSRCTGRIGL